MEFLKINIYFHRRLHYFEAIVEGYVQRAPHLFGDFLERAIAIFYLLVENMATLWTASVAIEEDMP